MSSDPTNAASHWNMVYTGRPTTGCSRCRERRKKCDETKPWCQNCIRIGRECPGYPDQLDSMFRDETEIVSQRVTSGRSGRQSRKASTSLSVTTTPPEFVPGPAPSFNTIPGQENLPEMFDRNVNFSWVTGFELESGLIPTPDVTLQAKNYFWSTYAVGRDERLSAFDVLKPMLEVKDDDATLQTAFEALAVRAYANQCRRPDLFEHAQQLYGKALSRLHQQIEDVEHEPTAKTLMATLVFAVYELVTSPKTEDGQRHIDGAVSIIKSRSSSHAENSDMTIISRTAKGQMLINAIVQRTAMQDLAAFEGLLPDSTTPNFKCADSLPNLLAKADSLLDDNRTSEPATEAELEELEELLGEAYEHQKALYQDDISMPSNFSYQSNVESTPRSSKAENESSEAWPGPIHIYPDTRVASVRNCSRVLQLLCSQVIVNLLRRLNPDGHSSDRRHKDAMYRMQYLIDDIAASVPHQLNPKGDKGKATVSSSSSSRASVSGAYMLIWPLHVATQMPCISDSQQKWFEGRLGVILQQYGIKNANLTKVAADAARAHAECLGGSMKQSVAATLAEGGFAYRYQKPGPEQMDVEE